MIDGFGEDYYRASEMPNLNKMEKEGIYKVVPSLMPAVTNVNNIAIATGDSPEKNGITGNVYYNPETEKEEYIEDPILILTPTIFERAKKAGTKSALFSCKKKTVDLMGQAADIRLCPECNGADSSEFSDQFGSPPNIYSKEASYWIFKSAIYAIQKNPDLGSFFLLPALVVLFALFAMWDQPWPGVLFCLPYLIVLFIFFVRSKNREFYKLNRF